MAQTQAERKSETRGRLIAAAAELFARQGFGATSTDAVAAEADRTSGALYAHFGSKEGLLLALLEVWKDATAEETEAALDAAPTYRERMAALWRSIAEPPRERGGDAWVLLEHELWLFAARNPDTGMGLTDRYADARHAMGAAFEVWADERGAELPASGDVVAVLALGLMLGLEMQRRIDPAVVPDDLAVDALAGLIGLPEE